jgi:ribosomal protein S19E (S16A)
MAKLTANQQAVVDRMRDGWVLESTRESFGGKVAGMLVIKRGTNGGEWESLHRGLLKQLEKKGIIKAARRVDWLTTEYVLTERGN